MSPVASGHVQNCVAEIPYKAANPSSEKDLHNITNDSLVTSPVSQILKQQNFSTVHLKELTGTFIVPQLDNRYGNVLGSLALNYSYNFCMLVQNINFIIVSHDGILLKRLTVAGKHYGPCLSLWRPGFISGLVRVGVELDKRALGQIFRRIVLLFSCQYQSTVAPCSFVGVTDAV